MLGDCTLGRVNRSEQERPGRPSGLTEARRTPTFTAESVPPALLQNHRTSVWAQLEVESGTVEFVEEDGNWRAIGAPGAPVSIVPDRPHRVVPSADATFAVQFFDEPAG